MVKELTRREQEIPEQFIAPPVLAEALPYFEAFLFLDEGRVIHAGMTGALPQSFLLTEVEAYARNFGWDSDDGSAADFMEIIRRIDGAYLEEKYDHMSAEQLRAQRQSSSKRR